MARYVIAYAHPRQRQTPLVPLAILAEDELGVVVEPIVQDLDALAQELEGDLGQWRSYAARGLIDAAHPLRRARPSIPRTPRGYDCLECYLDIPISESMRQGSVSFFGGIQSRPGPAAQVAVDLARELSRDPARP